MQRLKVKDTHTLKILTKKAIILIAILISGKIDFKTKALLRMEELFYDKRLSTSRRYNSFKHYTQNETVSKIYKALLGIIVKGEINKSLATMGD